VIPYLKVEFVTLGPIHLPVFLLLVCTALVVASAILVMRGHRLGLAYERTEEMCLWAALAGATGAFLFRNVYAPPAWTAVLANPAVVFGRGVSSFGGFFGGFAGILAFFRWRKIGFPERWMYLDAAAFALPFGWIFGRIGCALVHDHPGVRTMNWLAVNFPGGPRYDLGLLEVFFLFLLGCAFLLLDRKPRPSGFYFGLFFTVYGLFRLALDQLHVDPPRYFAITVDQYAGSAAALLGICSFFVVAHSFET
jgi:phosphatidylglycerol:prolipoprotein diacylglycerol transferase